MIDLSPYDSPRGAFPLQTEPRLERVLHIHLHTPQEPQVSLCNALTGLTNAAPMIQPQSREFARVPWTAYKDRTTRMGAIREAVARVKPTLVFMQLQTPGVLSPDDLRVIRNGCVENAVLVSWCGDVGRDPRWSHELAPELDVVAFSSMTQVREHREAGFPNAAYLQIGYDEDIHFDPGWEGREGRIVFLGQNYRDTAWSRIEHEAQLRRDVVHALEQLGDGYGLHLGGQNWGKGVQTYDRRASAKLYQTSEAALSISLTSKLERYSSDRLLRALACGGVVLVKRFDDMESWGLRDCHNCVVWDTVDDLFDRWTPEGFDPAAIGAAGAELARDRHTWGQRMRELAVYVEGVRRART